MRALAKDKQIALIGAGTMGAGIAQVAAAAGHPVVLYDIGEGAAEKGIANVEKGLQKLIERGKLPQQQVDQLIANITPTTELKNIKDAALVIEAIVENLDVKQRVLSDVEAICADDVIIASNTSSISISAIAAKLQRPQNVVGMHFFNPAPILKLVEVVAGLKTDKKVAETVFATAKAWGKLPVHAKATPGFIVNRVARPFYAEALRSLTEQLTTPACIDALMREGGGFRMGPLELIDLIGMDVNSAVSESVYAAYYQDKRFLPSVLQAEMVAGGLLGKKSGQGFYDYSKDKPAVDAAAARKLDKPISIDSQYQSIITCLVDKQAEHQVSEQADGNIRIGDTVVRLTDGRTASETAAQLKINDVVLFDYAVDYAQVEHVALAAATQASVQAINDATAFFQSIGKQVCHVKDLPGIQVMRTVCMLINEAHDAVNQGVCNEDALDLAMQAGVSYPRGLFEWCEMLGAATVVTALQNIQGSYAEERYRVSPLLLQKSLLQKKLS